MSSIEPQSRAGSALLTFLLNDSTRTAMALVRHPRSSPELLYQAFTLMARRRFIRTPESDSLELLKDALVANDSASEERIRWANDVLEHALQTRAVGPVAIPRKHQDVVITILLYLVREADMTGDSMAALVRSAELRLKRVQRLNKARNGWGFMKTLLRHSGPPVKISQTHTRNAVSRNPSSVVGNRLRALAHFDTVLADSYPEEPDDAAAAAMIDAVFRKVLMARLAAPLASGDAARFASAMTSMIPGFPVSAVELTALVMEALGSGGQHSAVRSEDALRAKVFVFMETVEQIGLFDEEIDDLVSRAEDSVRSAGLALAAWNDDGL